MSGRSGVRGAVASAQALLDALPMVVLVVDEDRRIRALNGAARELLRKTPFEILGRRPGDALACENSLRDDRGCGHASECRDCVLRRSADEAVGGSASVQRELRVAVRGGDEDGMIFLLSASPLRDSRGNRALVCLQDVTGLHRLRGLLPICAGCKKIRREDQAWEALEAFIETHSHAEFTHGLCPDCMTRFYPGAAGRGG